MRTKQRLAGILICILTIFCCGAVYGDQKRDQLSEPDMAALFTDAVRRPLIYFFYDDYDYNGTFEAMAVTEAEKENYVRVYFVSSDGAITDLTKGRDLCGSEFQDHDNARERYMVDTGTQKFYTWESFAGGSGSTSYIFGVRNGVPYEPEISGEVQDFMRDGNEIVFFKNDFTNGHDYIRTVLDFDPGSGEFRVSGGAVG